MEEVGFYNPATKEKILKGERIKYWISVGAQPSATIHNMLIQDKVIEGKKIPKHKLAKKPASAPSTGSTPLTTGPLGASAGKPATEAAQPVVATPEEVK